MKIEKMIIYGEIRMCTCCITGPKEIPLTETTRIQAALEYEIDRAVKDGYTCFISGFARGVDLIFAEAVAARIRSGLPLQLVAALPSLTRLKMLESKPAARALLMLCSEIYTVGENYSSGVYIKRNKYMVERSQRVIAVYSRSNQGDSALLIREARRRKLDLHIISLETQ